ncbi:MAG TPA: bifunctional transaldolase/phosoglucose isomerase [Terriglobia bacterium]|nr:bifunctional transaldolase/phosoglucose isomerase [Terriglobia bacterium]
MNNLKSLEQFGQAVWLDFIRRSLITSGELKRLIEEDGVRGVTSNPSIFEKAIVGSTDYTLSIDELYRQGESDPMTIYERLAIPDIQAAADAFRPVYEQTKRRDGYVSLEVSPFLAHETGKTIEEGRRLWRAVGRENIMIKVPGTPEGLPAIRQLLSEGININITLLFARDRYEQVAQAYIAALEGLAARGGDVSKVASVASFFVSRIDTLVDSRVAGRLKSASSATERTLLRSVMGKIAIANAKLAYQRYKELFSGERWQTLAAKGAQTQRLLWASTSTKNPKYRDVLYIEELIGPDTVNTIPLQTLEAYRDHGHGRLSLEEEIEEAQDIMEVLEAVGIPMQEVTDQLLKEAVRLFADAFDQLLNALDRQCKVGVKGRPDRQSYSIPQPLSESVHASIEDWHIKGKVRRLWARDATLWTGEDESNWMGWLAITEDQLAHKHHLESIAVEAREGGFTHALLLGMGGSSLCPEVMAKTFGKIPGYPELHILDSTDPAQIRAVEKNIDPARTLFIVSSKSGSTLEPNIFKDYFFARTQRVVRDGKAGNHFIAITDPGSKLQQAAESDGFRQIFYGVPSIGGRYSALSDFGMVPASIMGVDVPRLLDNAEVMATSCTSCVPTDKNPGVTLGHVLGALALKGRDKVTLITSPGIRDFGAWLEQLLAESTGKQGRGLIPVDREKLGPPEVYGNDRIFAYLRLESAPDAEQDAAIDRLEKAGQPVVRILLEDPYDLGREFFRWEVATAVAGSLLSINAFNQPDVEASKVVTRNLTAEYEKTGSLPPETPIFREGTIHLFADNANASALKIGINKDKSLASYLYSHLNRIQAGDYFALLAYIQMNDSHEDKLQAIRHAVRDAKRVATCLGFGPRFLHSTGQAYKGGPNTGVFLQITCDDANDLPIPGHKFTFGVVKAAQARGDFQVLAERQRRLLRVHLGPDVESGLETLKKAVAEALA